jgi:hypothetical protein
MSDQLTPLFEQLRGQQPPTPFAPPHAVRRRGRQRAHRQALAAGTAAFTAAGLAVGVPWIVDLDQRDGSVVGRTPTAAAPTTAAAPATSATDPPAPTVAGVPGTLMLRPDDVGPGVRAEEPDDQGTDGPKWPWARPECPDYRPGDYPAQGERAAARILAYASDGAAVTFETVERFPVGRGPAAFQEVLGVLAQCPSYADLGMPRFEPGTGWAYAYVDVAHDIGGDESVLVRRQVNWVGPNRLGPDRTEYLVAVRVGDLIATVELLDGGEETARTLGERAAARLA